MLNIPQSDAKFKIKNEFLKVLHNQYPSVHLILHSFNDSDAYLPVITDTLLYK